MDEHLRWANEEIEKELNQLLGRVDVFWEDAKQGAPAFADDAMSWSTKWRLAADCVPFTRGDRHHLYLRNRFQERLFSEGELTALIEGVVRQFVQAIDDVEGRMLVHLQADVADLYGVQVILPEVGSPVRFAARYRQALDQAVHHGMDAARDRLSQLVATELSIIISMRVMKAIATRIGVSGAVLGAGGGSSWGTLGTSVVAALIIDYIIGKLWDWWSDPRGQLIGVIHRELEAVRHAMLHGDGDHKGLRGELQEMVQQRARLRREAVFQLLVQEQQR